MHGVVGRRRPRAFVPVLAAVAVAALATVAGCGGGDGGDEEPRARVSTAPSVTSDSGSPSTAPTTVPTSVPESVPLAFDTAGSTTFPEVDVRKVLITDSVVVTLTPKELFGRSLPTLATAYETPAQGGVLTDVWSPEGSNTGVAVTVGRTPGKGTRLASDTYTVTRFDLTKGTTSATATVRLGQDPWAGDTPTTARVVGVAGDTVVLDSWGSAGPDAFADATARHTTVAVDLGSGSVAWTARPARPLDLTRTRVVVNTGTVDRPGTIRALGIRKGSTLWSSLGRVRSAASVGIRGDRMVVTTTGPGSDRARVTGLSLADGSAGAGRTTRNWNWTCDHATQGVAVCTVVSNRVVGWNIERNRPVWGLPTPRRLAPRVGVVVDGVVYGIANGTGVALDARTGRDRAVETGAVPTGVSAWGAVSLLDGQAVFQRRSDDGS